MSDQDFRERVLDALSRIKTQAKEHSTRLGNLERDAGWIKGKLEGSQEGINKLLTIFPLCTAVSAAIIALIALLT